MLTNDLFILGAGGFVGSTLAREAVRAGLRVGAWARSEAQAYALRGLGVTVTAPGPIPASRVVVDLIQPKLPERLTERSFVEAAQYRVETTREVLRALPDGALLFCVSGTDDFEGSFASHQSTFTPEPKGFARIGHAVRQEVAAAQRPFASVHLGTVYGPGKAFAATLFPKLAKGKLPVIGGGSNRLPLIHVEDAARALVHLAGLDAQRLRAHPWIVTDGTQTTQRELLELSAKLLGGPKPKSVPRWVASVIAGGAAAAFMSRDVPADASALVQSGFTYRFPNIQSGLPATLAQLKEAA
jgi:nucleoside-diphosphate-sugar epimerase